MHMMPKSNGCGYILHGCCNLTSWMEGRPARDEKARTIANWLFEDIICRWGCLVEIITDNGSAYRAATAWLEQKYGIGIRGIKISPYNSRANGKIERRHWDVRQMLTKATGGDTTKWYWFFYHVLWADRITIRKKLGCSPFFMVTGAQPTIPLDILEATWLIKLPGRILTTAELIGYRAKALAKHRQHRGGLQYEMTTQNQLRKYVFLRSNNLYKHNLNQSFVLSKNANLGFLESITVPKL